MSVFIAGYRGKTVQFSQVSTCHRTTIAHFLNAGKWDSNHLEEMLKKQVLDRIYGEAERTGKPVYCYVDDTISSKTKPSSKALHPIQDAYFHQSHLKKKQDYGHQAVSVIVRWNIEVFFRDAKQKLAFDKYQIRSSIGIKRFWLLMSLTHFLCCTGSGEVLSFEDGYAFFQRELLIERAEFIYRCGYAHIPLEKVLALVA